MTLLSSPCFKKWNEHKQEVSLGALCLKLAFSYRWGILLFLRLEDVQISLNLLAIAAMVILAPNTPKVLPLIHAASLNSHNFV